MKPEELLSQIRVATPCTASWDEMKGDDQRRFCDKCNKHVYNFSAMTSVEAAALIRETEGNLCGRLFVREDGRVMTSDCARPRREIHGFFKKTAFATVVVLLGTTGLLASNKMPGNSPLPKLRLPLPPKLQSMIAEFHDWIGATPKVTQSAPPPTPVVVYPPPASEVMGRMVLPRQPRQTTQPPPAQNPN